MKTYVKPTIEVINMKTAESIADDANLIKTIWEKAAAAEGQSSWVAIDEAATYNANIDHSGSTVA